MATHHLASWAFHLEYAHLPVEVVQAAIRTFYNWAGCAVGGSAHPTTTIASTALSPFFGPPSASLLGVGHHRVDAQHAALLNGIASHVHDYDDTHLDTIIHPAGPVASALLAAAEWRGPVSGQAFLLALICGIEAECKLGLAVWPEHYDIGWHITSSCGSIGAAVAVAKLFSLSIEQTAHAIGVAATQVTGLREMFGSDTKSFHPGRAAQNGLLAAVLAEKGYTSSLRALEAPRGWANVVSSKGEDGVQGNLEKWLGMGDYDHTNNDHESNVGLSGRWEILRNSFKPYPCGIVIHPVIDGCCQLYREMQTSGLELGLDAGNVVEIRVAIHPLVMELTGKTDPQNGLEGKFSFYHGAAVGILYGRATPVEYEDALVRDPKVIAIRKKVAGVVSPGIKADEARITLTMRNGQVLEKYVEHAIGSLDVPMSDEALQQKFKDQCRTVLRDVDAVSRVCWDIENADDVSEIAKALSLG